MSVTSYEAGVAYLSVVPSTRGLASKLRSQLSRVKEDVPVKADLDTTELMRKLKTAKSELSGLLKEKATLDADDKKLRAKLDKATAGLKELRDGATARFDADETRLTAKLDQAKAKVADLARMKADPQVDLDIAEAEKKRAVIAAKLDDLGKKKSTPAVEAQVASAEAALGRIDSRLTALNAKKANPEVQAKVDAAQREVAEFTAQLERLSGMRANPEVDPQISAARSQVAQFTAEFEALSAKRADPEVHARIAAAQAEVAAFKNELDALDGRTVNTKAQMSSSGFGQVSTVLDNLIIKGTVLASVLAAAGVAGAGAMGAIAAGGAIAAPGLGAAALGLAGVSDGVKALSDQQDKAGQTAGAAAKQQQASAQQIAAAQDRVGDAARRAGQARSDAARDVQRAEQESATQVGAAQQTLTRAAVSASKARADAARAVAVAEQQSARSVRSAQEQAARSISSALQQQSAANQRLQRATRDLAREQRALTSEWEQGRRSLEDLQDQVDGNALDQRQAAFDLKDAQAALAEAQAGGDQDQIARAQLAVDKQIESIDQLNKRTQRGAVDNAAAQRAGVAGTDQYRAAVERVAAAQEQVGDAAQAAGQADFALRQARIDGARSVAEAEQDGAARVAEARRAGQEQIADADQRVADARAALDAAQISGAQRVADAREQGARQIASADEALVDAQKALVTAQQAAATAAADSAADQLEAFNKLTPAQQKFARFLFGLRGEWQKLKETAAAGFLPGVQSGMEALLKRAPEINAFVGKYASAMGNLAKMFGEEFASQRWVDFFTWLGDRAGPTIDQFGRITINILRGVAGLIQGFAPLWDELGGGIEGATGAFARWGDEVAAGKSEGFNRFMEMVREYGPKVWRLVVDVAAAGWKVVEALAPLGGIVLDLADGFAKFIASLPPGTIQAIVIGIFGIVAAYKALKAVANAKDILGKLGLPGGGKLKVNGEVKLAKGETIKLAKGECVKLCKGAKCSCSGDGGGDDDPDGRDPKRNKKGKGGRTPAPTPKPKGRGGAGGAARGAAGGAIGAIVGGVGSEIVGAATPGELKDPGQSLPQLIGNAAGENGSGLMSLLSGDVSGGQKILDAWSSVWGRIGSNASTWWDNYRLMVGQKAYTAYDTVMSWFDERGLKGWIGRKYDEISTNVSTWWDNFKTTVGLKAWAVYDTVMSWFDERGLKGWIQRKYDEISTNISLWWDNFKTTVGYKAWLVYDTVMSWFDERGLKGWLQRKYDEIATNIGLWWDNFKTTVGYKAWLVYDTVMSWFDERGLKGWLQRKYDEIATNISLWWDNFKITIGYKAWLVYDTIMSWFDERGLKGWLQRKYDEIALNISLWWDNFKTTMGLKAYQTYDLIMSWFDERGLKGWLQRKFDEIKTGAEEKWEALKTAVVGKAIGVYNDVTGWFGRLGGWLAGFWQGVVDTAGRIWGQIKAKTAEPINFVIQEVYGKHIRGVWGAIQGWIPGLPNLAPPGPAIAFAQGGFHEDHRAQITSPGGPTRIWSEPETGGEAYIPMGRSKRARSTAILGQVADNFGLSIARKDRGMLQQYANGGITKVAHGPMLEFADGGLIAFGRRLQSMGYDVAEHPAFGGVGDHGPRSLHYSGNAIDVNKGAGTSPQEQAALGRIVPLAREYGLRTIFMSPGHYNHAHFDTGQGADIRGGGGLFGSFDPVQMLKDRFSGAIGAISGLDRFGDGPFIQAAKGIPNTVIDALVNFAKDKVPFLGGGMMGATSNEAPGIVKIISDAARMRGFGREGAVIGTATGLVESELRNLPGGDRDSVGVFQQRPSMGWGTVEQCMNVMYAATKFFSRFPGNWRSMPPGDVAQGVQRSAFGYKYATRMAQAADLVGQHGGAFDQGGVADEIGWLWKGDRKRERMLPPKETQSYDTLTRISQQFEAGRMPAMRTPALPDVDISAPGLPGATFNFPDARFGDPVDVDTMMTRADFLARSAAL